MTLLLAAAAAALAIALNAAGSPGMAIDHAVTVQPGQTLSELAAQQLPALGTAQAVVEIQVANHLSSSQVHAGQRLQIPVAS